MENYKSNYRKALRELKLKYAERAEADYVVESWRDYFQEFVDVVNRDLGCQLVVESNGLVTTRRLKKLNMDSAIDEPLPLVPDSELV